MFTTNAIFQTKTEACVLPSFHKWPGVDCCFHSDCDSHCSQFMHPVVTKEYLQLGRRMQGPRTFQIKKCNTWIAFIWKLEPAVDYMRSTHKHLRAASFALLDFHFWCGYYWLADQHVKWHLMSALRMLLSSTLSHVVVRNSWCQVATMRKQISLCGTRNAKRKQSCHGNKRKPQTLMISFCVKGSPDARNQWGSSWPLWCPNF